MKKIYYLLVCLFIPAIRFCCRGETVIRCLFTEWAEHECGSLYGWNIPDSGYSSFNLF